MCNCTNTKQPERKPHVHADVIKAWADGAEVEFYNKVRGDWEYCSRPAFAECFAYRIKPEPKPLTDLEKYGVEVGDVWCVHSDMKVVSRIQPNTSYVGGSAVKFTDIRLTLGIGSEDFNRLMFRRGVVNNL